MISQDSDFFIFDLKAGCIPLEYLEWDSSKVEAKLFKVEAFVSHLGIHKYLIPLLASFMGNDIVKYPVRKGLWNAMGISHNDYKNTWKKMKAIKAFLERENVTSIQQGLKSIVNICTEHLATKDRLRSILESSVKSYQVRDAEVKQYFETGELCSTLKTRHGLPFNHWVLELFRKGLFPKLCMVERVFFLPQAEDFRVASAHQCSRPLRRFLYGLQGKRKVEEFTRDKVEGRGVEEGEEPTVKCRVQSGDHELQSRPGEPLRLVTIPLLDERERRDAVLSILESNTSKIRGLPPEDQLFSASVHYWIKHAELKVRESHLRALLLCYVTLAKGEHNQDAAGSDQVDEPDAAVQHNFAGPRKPRFDRKAQHNFAQ